MLIYFLMRYELASNKGRRVFRTLSNIEFFAKIILYYYNIKQF